MSRSAAVVVPALKKQTATIIWAHGLGDSGNGWDFLAENLRRKGKYQDVKFVFPNAPNIPITVNFGMRMPGWYDITTFDELAKDAHDERGILRSRNLFNDLIQSEVDSGISSNKILLGGFSQGGAMSIFTGLTTNHKLGGVVGLSCYLLLGDKLEDLATGANKHTPVFMGHGDSDPLVKYQWGKSTAETLEKMGHKVDFKTYKGVQHEACEQELEDLEKFIDKALSSSEDGPASGL